jgi:hypothetical protein
VASADGGEQTNTTDQTNSQAADSEGGGGGVTGSVGGNTNESENKTEVDVDTDVDGGDGGTNESNVNTGVQGAIIIVVADDEEEAKVLAEYQAQNGSGGHGEDAEGEINIETDSVSVEQNANGGNVDNSGNVDLGKLELPDQTNNVAQSNNQTATSEDDGRHGRPHHGDWDNKDECNNEPSLLSTDGCEGRDGHHGDDGVTGNIGGNENESENEVDIDIDTDVDGGDGGENYSNVNTGLQDVVLKCIAIGGGDAKCIFNITTGSVTVIQNANGGNVTNSGNVGSGDKGREYAGAKPHANAPKHYAPQYRAAAPALSSAQPSGQLAYTGSDVSAPLTVGLLALGAGAGLTLLGRRSAHAA